MLVHTDIHSSYCRFSLYPSYALMSWLKKNFYIRKCFLQEHKNQKFATFSCTIRSKSMWQKISTTKQLLFHMAMSKVLQFQIGLFTVCHYIKSEFCISYTLSIYLSMLYSHNNFYTSNWNIIILETWRQALFYQYILFYRTTSIFALFPRFISELPKYW